MAYAPRGAKGLSKKFSTNMKVDVSNVLSALRHFRPRDPLSSVFRYQLALRVAQSLFCRSLDLRQLIHKLLMIPGSLLFSLYNVLLPFPDCLGPRPLPLSLPVHAGNQNVGVS
nr:hypothetical protein BaRGS_017339 [Batillaria attramentaria]